MPASLAAHLALPARQRSAARGTSADPSSFVLPNPATARPPRSISAQPELEAPTELRRRLPELLPDLHARALRLARDRALADDVVQDTVERALRFEYQYEQNSNLRGWLTRILQSVFITRCRSRRRQQRAFEALAADPCAWMASDPSPMMCELSPNAARALDAIPEAFRQAIELVDLADLSYRDAAETIGVPLGTVMSRLHRGRKLLAQALSENAPQSVSQAA